MFVHDSTVSRADEKDERLKTAVFFHVAEKETIGVLNTFQCETDADQLE